MGDVLPKPQGSGYGSLLDPHEDFILGLVAADKDITLVEMADQLEAERGLRVVPATHWCWLDRRERSPSKERRTPASSSVPTCGERRALPGAGSPWPLEDKDLYGRSAPVGHDGTHGA
ncbi:MAG: hypothetical protein AAFQ29_07445 [Pseudomonadota bacterium]